MKVFLSAIENATSSESSNGTINMAEYIVSKGVKMKWNLMSYYYIRQRKGLAEFIRDNSEEILIDSGAHSFQKGTKVDWDLYTQEYANFIKTFDRNNVVGYFEMDVDNIIGYPKVLELRKVLERVSDKIIPVWHKNRKLDEFKKMCQDYSGKIVAITGFKNEDIKDDQYLMFLKYAKKAVFAGIGAMIFWVIISQITLLFQPNEIDVANGAFQSLFTISFRTTLASILMYGLANFFDVILFDKLSKLTKGKHLWLRNNVCTIVCNCLENFGFIFLAFYGVFETGELWSIALVTCAIETIIALFDTPFAYIAKKLTTKGE